MARRIAPDFTLARQDHFRLPKVQTYSGPPRVDDAHSVARERPNYGSEYALAARSMGRPKFLPAGRQNGLAFRREESVSVLADTARIERAEA